MRFFFRMPVSLPFVAFRSTGLHFTVFFSFFMIAVSPFYESIIIKEVEQLITQQF